MEDMVEYAASVTGACSPSSCTTVSKQGMGEGPRLHRDTHLGSHVESQFQVAGVVAGVHKSMLTSAIPTPLRFSEPSVGVDERC